MRSQRTYVRRDGPGRLVFMTALLALGMGLFLAFARPAMVKEAAREQIPEERATVDVTLEGEGVYLVELCRERDEAKARVEAARYVPRGAAGYIMKKDGEFLVIGSGYEEKSEAEQVSLNLTVGESLDCVVHVVAKDAVRLRVTATDDQLQAFTGADETIRRVSRLLRESSLALDKGQTTPLEIRASLLTELPRAQEARDALKDAAGHTPNAVVKTWIEVISLACERVGEVSKKDYQSALYFSSALKHAFLDVRLRHIDALNGLL